MTFDLPIDAKTQEAIQSQKRALSYYSRECEASTGKIDPEAANKRSDRKLLLDTSDTLAQRLEALGIGGYSQSSESNVRIGIFSGAVEEIPAFRRSNIIPIVAAEKRAPILRDANAYFGLRKAVKALSFENDKREMETAFLSDLQTWQRRTWTVTFGENVPAKGLKAALKWISRKVSKARTHPIISRYFDIALRSFEIGSRYKKRDGKWELDADGKKIPKLNETGEQLWHPHCHLLVLQTQWIDKADLETVTEAIRDHFEGCWWDGGVIDDLHEIVKYVAKPMEIGELPDNEIEALHKALFKARIVEGYGGFRVFRRALKALKLRPIAPKHEGQRWRFVESHNAHWRAKDDKGDRKDAADLAKVLREKKKAENVLLAMLPPQAMRGSLREPVAIVNGYTGDLKALCNDVRFRVAWSAGIQGWQAAIATHGSDQRERASERATRAKVEPDTKPVIVRGRSPKTENPDRKTEPGVRSFNFWQG